MRVKKLGYMVQGYSLILLCTGCANNSVQDIKIDDENAVSGAIQLNYHHMSERHITQLEIQKAELSGHLNISAATNPNGMGEERLRNTRDQDLPQNQFIGVGVVKADYELQQVSVRHIFKVDANGRFQIDLAPEVALMQLDSHYSTGSRGLSLDMGRLGAGITVTARWQFLDYLSLNVSGNHTVYEGDTRGLTHLLFLRFQPAKHFYVDVGRYDSSYDFGEDTRISYERRVQQTYFCIDECAYIYDGTQNSDLEVDAVGYRLGIGFDF